MRKTALPVTETVAPAGILALLAVDPDRLDQPSTVIVRDADCSPFLGLFAWNVAADNRARQRHVVDPAELYPLAAQNRQELYHLSDVVGQEGWDFQNPYAWAARGVLVEPTPQAPGLSPRYGVNAGETAADVALNIRSTSGILDVGNVG